MNNEEILERLTNVEASEMEVMNMCRLLPLGEMSVEFWMSIAADSRYPAWRRRASIVQSFMRHGLGGQVSEVCHWRALPKLNESDVSLLTVLAGNVPVYVMLADTGSYEIRVNISGADDASIYLVLKPAVDVDLLRSVLNAEMSIPPPFSTVVDVGACETTASGYVDWEIPSAVRRSFIRERLPELNFPANWGPEHSSDGRFLISAFSERHE